MTRMRTEERGVGELVENVVKAKAFLRGYLIYIKKVRKRPPEPEWRAVMKCPVRKQQA